mgnify:CR=1 FL=1
MSTPATPGPRRSDQFIEQDVLGSYGKKVLFANPNGESPLFAISERNRGGFNSATDGKIGHYRHDWPTQRLPIQGGSFTASEIYTGTDMGTKYTAAATPAGTSLVVKVTAAIAKEIRPKHTIKLEKTGDRRHRMGGTVTNVVVNGASSYVVFTTHSTASATYGLDECDYISVKGNENAQFGARPDGVKYDPVLSYNATQIFRTPYGMSRTAQEMALRWGKPWARDKKMAGILHRKEIESSFIWGEKAITVGDNGDILTRMGGLIEMCEDYADDAHIADYALDTGFQGISWADGGKDFLDAYLETLGLWGKSERLFLCGIAAKNAFTKVAAANSTYNISKGENSFGMQIDRFEGSGLTLQLRTHPLMNLDPVMKYGGIIMNPEYLHYLYITDTMVKRDNSQEEGGVDSLDGRLEEILTECTFQYDQPKELGVLYNLGVDNELA